MKIELDVALDPTLGCGQAHRWIKKGGSWEGVLGRNIVTLTQTENGFECSGTEDRDMVLDYFRPEDDLKTIRDEISSRDPFVARLVNGCKGMRILRQEPWECIATYLLATNANVKRIDKMVENVCCEFGHDLGGRYSFPTPQEIIAGEKRICNCRLGYRDERFVELAHKVDDGVVVPSELMKMDYDECRNALLEIKGVGDKVADCIALFGYGHLESFPIDARIGRVLRDVYGVDGSYAKLAQYGREKFGRYAGYAQEFLYHGDTILGLESQAAQAGGLQPI
jgi:N-glycosylase/DNA lyase